MEDISIVKFDPTWLIFFGEPVKISSKNCFFDYGPPSPRNRYAIAPLSNNVLNQVQKTRNEQIGNSFAGILSAQLPTYRQSFLEKAIVASVFRNSVLFLFIKSTKQKSNLVRQKKMSQQMQHFLENGPTMHSATNFQH